MPAFDSNAFLKKLWEDPKFGLFSPAKFYKNVKKQYPNVPITSKQTHAFVKKQEAFQINKQPTKQGHHHIVAPYPNSGWQMDLLDLSKYYTANSHYKWILVIIDINSRYLWLIPLKNKKEQSLADALNKHFKSVKPPVNITSDNGSEFINKSVQAIFKKHKIKHWLADVGDHGKMGIVERVNRTVRTLLSKYWTLMNTKQWYPVIGDIAYNYNNSVHRTIKARPVAVYDGVDYSRPQSTSAKISKFSVGDRVRKIITRNVFDKPVSRYSKATYEIVKVGKSLTLKNDDGDILKTKAKPSQLQLITEVQTAVKKVNDAPDTKVQISKQKIALLHKQLGIDKNNVIEEVKRIRKPNPKYQ
jgi:hypothetical protein